MENLQAKLIFREHYGEFSDSLWYRLKASVFSKDFPLTEQNIIFIAQIKKMMPRFNLNNLDIVQTVKTVNLFLNSQNSKTLTGLQLLELLRKYEIEVHKNTLTKWFKPLGGYSRNRPYTLSEITPIILAAFTFKFRRSIAATVSK
jgi:hypothetical protein